MNLLDTEFLREFVRACDDGWHMGWHESHGGNMRYRLTDEEKAQRAKEFEAYKASVAARKEARQLKRAAAEALFNDRRTVEFDVTELRKASEALLSMTSAPISDVRANINTLMAAVQKADELMHHRAKAATVTIK